MPEQQPRVPIPFPLKGLEENFSFDEASPGTTRDLLNVRAIDPKTGRTRGAQRSGMSRYLDDVLGVESGANAKIQEMIAVPRVNRGIEYRSLTAPEQVWAASPGDGGTDAFRDIVDLKIDDFGNLYAAQQLFSVYKYNPDGHQLAKIDVPWVTIGAPEITFVEVDERQNLFIGTGRRGADQPHAKLYAYEFQLDGTYALAWSIDNDLNFADGVIVKRSNGTYDLVTAQNDQDGVGPTDEAYLTVWSDVTMGAAPVENAGLRVVLHSATTGAAFYANRMARSADGAFYVSGFDIAGTLADISEMLWKANPYLEDSGEALLYSIEADGVGLGVIAGPKAPDGKETLYTVGRENTSGASGVNVRRIRDLGGAFELTGSGAWTFDTGQYGITDEGTIRNLRIDTDHDGNLYIPGVSSDDRVVRILSPEGAELHSFDDSGILNDRVHAVAVSSEQKPDGFDSGDSGSGIDEVEFVYFATNAIGATGGSGELVNTIYKYRLAEAVQTLVDFRTFHLLAIGGGVVERFTQGGTFAAVTGGTTSIDADAPYVQSIVSIAKYDAKDQRKGRLRAYITDGRYYWKYDPEDDAVTPWISTSQGVIPPRCRLLELWQGRAVLARDPENPVAWHMSAIQDPENWDNFPQNTSPAQAISGVNARAGDCPDIVNTLVPWNDDLLVFGCDHSIWRMDGNPMAGGQFSLVTDQTGMAFGRPWCREPGGQRIFFMSTQCGVYALERNGGMLRLTRDRIERRLQDSIDFSSHYVRLVWNYRDEGLHVFQIPFGAGGTVVKHWFWDRKNDAWFEDQIGSSADTAKQPTAVFLLDGDAPTDRALLLGGEDGRVRVWDGDSPNDDFGTATDLGAGGGDDLLIDSYVTIGPIQPKGHGFETQFTELRVWLARDQDGVNYDVFVDDEPDFSLDLAPVASGSLSPGHNDAELVRFTGDSCYLRLRNAYQTQGWAFERATIAYAPGGMKRR